MNKVSHNKSNTNVYEKKKKFYSARKFKEKLKQNEMIWTVEDEENKDKKANFEF